MITLITGVTGAGKSLFGIDLLLTRTGKKWDITNRSWLGKLFGKKVSKFEKTRPVFYYHIDGLDEEKTGWVLMDNATGWNNQKTYPKGSIFIIDEAHKWFPKTGTGQLPKHVEDFSEHRHDGYDFIFMTQEQMMLNHHIRGLVNTHIHFERQEGYESNTRYKWNKLGKITDYHSKQEAQKKRQSFKSVKYVYPLYKSSSEHTSEKTIPFYFYVLPIALIFLVFMGYRLISKFTTDNIEPLQELVSQSEKIPQNSNTFYSGSVTSRYNDHYLNTEYIQKGYYPDDIVTSKSVYKKLNSIIGTYYNFTGSNGITKYSKADLEQQYSLNIDTLTECRDALYMPEIKTVFYSVCEPQEVFDKPALYYSGMLGSQPRKTVVRSTNTQSKIKKIPSSSINPFKNMLN